jgi:hypothetical protein
MSAGCDAAFLSSSQFFSRPLRELVRIAAWLGVLGVTLFGSWHAASAQATLTTTTLMVTTASGAVTTAPAGTVITLTATVQTGTSALTQGQVNFCDASAAFCTDIHLLGKAQLTGAGTAIMKFRPGLGTHSYRAIFLGTNSDSGSSSGTSALAVTGTPYPLGSSTTIAETGSWGNYALTATVTEYGGTAAPTGSVSFLDTSEGSYALANANLESPAAGIHWPTPLGLSLPTNSPSATAVGDFNGDGILDLVVNAGGPSQPLVIFLGNANGTYASIAGPSIFTYSFGPIVVADFNGDGKLDMAVLNANSSVVTILLGNGDGTFTISGSSPASGSGPNQLAVGDFNGDGFPDLAVTDTSTNSVNILLGKGDGTFTVTASPPTVGSSPYAIAMGDFNGDGKLDLAVTDTYDDAISIVLGNGDGTFAAATTLHSGSTGSPIVAADFTGDGKLDLAVGVAGTGGASDSVTILSGNGDGTFSTPQAGTATSANSISAIHVGDFNADGSVDLVLTDSNIGTFTVFLGDGTGSFTANTVSLPGSPTFGLCSVTGDINGDGRTDLLVGVSGSASALAYLTEAMETATATANVAPASVGAHLVDASYSGDSDYNSSTSATIPLWGQLPASSITMTVTSGGSPVTSVTPGTAVTLTATILAGATPITNGQVKFCDASAAECTDIHLLATAEITSAGTAAYKFVPGPGTYSYIAELVEGGFGLASSSAASSLTVGPAPSVVYSDNTAITASGLPGDYTLTATVVGFGGPAAPTGNILFLDTSFGNTSLGTAPLGPATAGLGFLTSQAPALSGAPTSQVTGDFNGDGIPDLAFIWSSSSFGGPYSVTIFFGKGDGTFTAGPTVSPAGVQSYPVMLAGDFNSDGKTDLALLSYDGSTTSYITTLLGKGDGTFGTPQTGTAYHQGVTGGDVILGSFIEADFNGDGKLDLAVVGDYVNTGGITILLGNGDGTFRAQPNLVPSLGFGVVVAGDFNGDGIPDLIAFQYFEGGGTVLLGKGDGTFTATATAPAAGTFVRSSVVGDFNMDGKLDLAIGYSGGVTVFLGNGDGTFQPSPNGTISGSGQGLVAGDFNHDGLPDLVAATSSGGSVSLYIGTGNGNFTTAVSTLAPSQQFNNPLSLISADFNGDGRLDLALLQSGVDNASILITEPTEMATATVNSVAPVGAATHLVEASYPGDSTYPASISGTTSLTAGVALPVISPSSGTFSSAQSITITDPTPGATIFYRASGAMTTNGFVPYTSPVPLEGSGALTILAYATENGYVSSQTASATLTANFPVLATPVFSLSAGSYSGAQSVTISDSSPGATIYYTTDGSTPTTGSNVYSSPVSVSATETVKAIATAPGYANSAVATAAYTINQLTTPIIAWPIPGSIVYGTALDGSQLNATANVPGTFVYSPLAGTVLGAGTRTLLVIFTPTDTTDYKTATANVTLTVKQATPSITWATPAPIAFGVALDGTQLDATASVPGTFTYNPTAETIPAVGSDTLRAVLTPTDATNYTTATASVTLIVGQPVPILGSLSPAFGSAGGSAFLLTVGGSGFTSASVVEWGSTALSTQLVSGTQLTAQVPASAITSAGTVAVKVQNPAPGGGASNIRQFEIDSAGSNTPPTFGVIAAAVSPGSSTTYPVTLPSGANDVSAMCLNLPGGSTCSYSAANSAVTITTSSTTPAGTYQILIVFTETISGPASAIALLPILLSPLMFLRRRRAKGFRFVACLALLTAAAVTTNGCGGGGGSITPPPPQTHQITNSATVTLTVQ